MVVLASAGGNTVPAIARLVQADEDTIRQVIHRFNEMGMASLDPRWAGGRPRLISPDDEQFIVTTANTRPETLVRPFTRWSVRKLADHLGSQAARPITIGRERLRQLLLKHQISFQRTKTWKESNDPQRDAKLARIEHVTSQFPQRVFAFDEFGPLVIRPQAGSGWAPRGHPRRLPANYHKLHGVRQFHGCYSVGDDQLWGVVHRRKGAMNTLAALKSIRRQRPDGAPIYVILDPKNWRSQRLRCDLEPLRHAVAPGGNRRLPGPRPSARQSVGMGRRATDAHPPNAERQDHPLWAVLDPLPALLALKAGSLAAVAAGNDTLLLRLLREPTRRDPTWPDRVAALDVLHDAGFSTTT